MNATTRIITMLAVLSVLAGCGGGTKVMVPPRVDLTEYETIGMVEFTTNSEGNLGEFASQKFVQTLQSSQAGIRILELGAQDHVLEQIQRHKLDHDAVRAIGEHYNVDAVVVGQMDVTDVKPNVNLSSLLSSMSVSAEVKASMAARLYDTGSGATLWTNSARGKETVAHVGVTSGGPVRFGAGDPEAAYGKLVNGLVYHLTHDFRVSYVKQ